MADGMTEFENKCLEKMDYHGMVVHLFLTDLCKKWTIKEIKNEK